MYYSLLNFSKENFIEKHKSGENPKIQTNTQNPLKTSLFNLIWSYRVVIDPTSMVDHVWPNINQVLQTLTIHFSQSDRLICHTSPTPISHHILQIQRSNFGFKSKALWTCVVPTHQEILIGHVLLIQPFDWVQYSSKPIFYPTILIQWSNVKSNSSTKWMHVIASTYYETSIAKNIQYSSKRVIRYINITKNR